jgi:putative acetyltransferase
MTRIVAIKSKIEEAFMINIRQETNEDIENIHYVNEQAFGQPQEANIISKLRTRGKVSLSLVAIEDGNIIGHILFSPVTIESNKGSFEAITLAPMAVLPEYQHKGIGSKLVVAGIEECRRLGFEMVTVLGHPDFYPRFGFVPAQPKGINCEFDVPEEAWMILELEQGALTGRKGTVKFQPEFHEAM